MKEIVIIACVFMGGCSQLMTSPIEDQYLIHSQMSVQDKINNIQCTKSKAGPILDTIGAGIFTIFSVAEISASTKPETKAPDGPIGAVSFAVVASLLAVSAIDGFNNASDCKKLVNYFKRLNPTPISAPAVIIVKRESSIKIEINNNIQPVLIPKATPIDSPGF